MTGFRSFAALAFAVILSSSAMATTRYVDCSCAQNGNGSTTTCGANGPWNNPTRVTCTGWVPGDILELRGGTCPVDNWNMACSGTSGNPIIVQNYANENVIWDGTTDIRTSTWTSQGGGAYLCTGGKCGTGFKFPFRAWYKRGSNPEEALDLIQSNRTCDSSLPAGKMRYTSGGAVCARLSDGSSPASTAYFRIPTSDNAVQLISYSVHDATLRRNPAGGSFTMQRYVSHGLLVNQNNTRITIDGLDVGWVMDRCINDSAEGAVGGNGVFIVRNSTVHHCGQEGIDARTRGSGSVIENNEIYAIQSPPVFEKCYQVGSGCQSGMGDNGAAMMIGADSSIVIRNNVVHDYGGGTYGRAYGLSLEAGSPNALVENNYFYNAAFATDVSAYGGHAIILEGSGNNYGGTVIRNNRAYNVDICWTLNTPNPTGTVVFENNTCVDPAWTGALENNGNWGTGAPVLWRNMLFANPSRTLRNAYIQMTSATSSRATTSAFYCPSPYCASTTNIVRWGSSNYANSQVGLNSYNPGNLYGNPNLAMSGLPPSLKILSQSGSAYNNGATIGASSAKDFEGDARPQYGAWDIGADELNSGQPAAPVLLEVVPVP